MCLLYHVNKEFYLLILWCDRIVLIKITLFLVKTHSLPSFYNDDSAKYEHSESQFQYGMYWNSFIHRCKQNETKELSPSDVHFHIIIFVLLNSNCTTTWEYFLFKSEWKKKKETVMKYSFFWKCAFYSQYFLIEKQRKRHIYKDEMI